MREKYGGQGGGARGCDMQIPWRCGGGWKCRVSYCKVCPSACTESIAEAQKELRRWSVPPAELPRRARQFTWRTAR